MADNSRCDFQNVFRWLHKDANVQVGSSQTQNSPKDTENCRCFQSVRESLPDPAAFFGSVIDGDNRLRGLANAVSTALDKSADIYNGTIDRQGVGSQTFHDLAVK